MPFRQEPGGRLPGPAAEVDDEAVGRELLQQSIDPVPPHGARVRRHRVALADGVAVDVGGRIVGRPGLAVEPNGDTRSYVLGTGGRVYVAWTSPARVSSPFRPGPTGLGAHGISRGWAPR